MFRRKQCHDLVDQYPNVKNKFVLGLIERWSMKLHLAVDTWKEDKIPESIRRKLIVFVYVHRQMWYADKDDGSGGKVA